MTKKDMLIVAALTLAALGVRLVGFNQTSADVRDFVIPWYEYIRAHGGFAALADNFSNYTPPYTYFLALITYLPWLPAQAGIKLISVVFDYGLALLAAGIVRRQVGVQAGWMIYILCLFSPAVFFESAFWGQCDGIYTFFLALCLWAFLKGETGWGIAFISIAFAIKAQGAFLGVTALVILLLRFQWKFLLIPPAAFLAMMAPALAAGRSLESILMVYPLQAGTVHLLSVNAPNLYGFISNQFYDAVVPIGLILTAVAAAGLVALALLRRSRLDEPGLVLLTVFSLFLVPYLLPKMHDRYFYAAAFFSLLLPFYFPRLWPVTLVLQITTPLAYLPFLNGMVLLTPSELGLLNLPALIFLGAATLRYFLAPNRSLKPVRAV